ncbi:hypothetical protein [Polyangium aurulentum]|uniref:hypothetical protein n=1 Tax=Polyangium aurulentum TaxID=2567896 RepID=UPI0010AE1A1B|nr:hypothetical protein [Polyangium aurulentum]UQA61292.1 hypothetical protein E8A73_012760 [Polyangium aurulentum]
MRLSHGCLLLGLAGLALGACAPGVPANWARGGATLDVPRARWIVGNASVEVFPDGRILINDEHELTVDRGGRVYDPSHEAVGLLEPDGRLVGPGDKPLGNVGVLHASRAEEANAWISVLPTGEVVRYGDNSERLTLGVWIGCNQSYASHQTCTLISHLLAPKIISAQQSMRYLPGYGMYPGGYMPGMGLPYR